MLFRSHVLVEMTSSSVVLGAAQIREKFEKEIERLGLSQEIRILDTGSFGAGLPSPFVVIFPDNVVYAPIKLDQVKIIVEEHLLKGRPVKDFMYSGRTETTPQDFRPLSPLAQEKRVVLRNSGYIDPTNIDDYIARDGYMALGKVLSGTPEEAIQIVKNSGLLGRGGAGYPTGLKWEYTQKAQGDEKYIVCNADEGEPGTFKDRLILEGDPHSILEAMAIAGFAVGAHQGYIYVRGEYPESIRHLEIAISQALDYGLLGDNLLNSGFSFRIDIRKGAGAYICGEELSLIHI
mgnify:FL=1